MSWFCISTNAVSILPARLLWLNGMHGDSVFTAMTGLASLLYHGNELENWPMNSIAIRNTDIVLANLLVLHTVHTIVAPDRRWECSVITLPFVVYSAELSLLVRFSVMVAYGTMCIVWMIIHRNRYDMRWLALGVLLILSELFTFFFGNQSNYVWLHGLHHVSAFSSQYCMIHSIKKINNM